MAGPVCTSCKFPLHSISSSDDLEVTCPECGLVQPGQYLWDLGRGMSRRWCFVAAGVSQIPMIACLIWSMRAGRWALGEYGMALLAMAFVISNIMGCVSGVWLHERTRGNGTGLGVFAWTLYPSLGLSLLFAIGIFIRIRLSH